MLTLWSVLLLGLMAGVKSQQTESTTEKPTIQPPNGMPYFSPSSSTLTCITNLTGYQKIYNFYRNGRMLAQNEWSNYKIYPGNKDQSGTYTCNVYNSTPSDGLYMTFEDVPKITASTDDPQIGDYLILSCNVSLQIPNVEFQWFKNNLVIPDKHEQIFQIASVAVSDEGEYSCLITIKNTTDDTTKLFSSDKSGIFTIVLSVPPQPTLSTDRDTTQGAESFLRCIPNSASPSFGLEWSYLYFNGERIVQKFAETTDYGTQFIQQHAMLRDSGDYACSLSNKRGESALSPLFNFRVHGWTPLSINLPDYDTISIRGSKKYISCYPRDRSYRLYDYIYYCTLYINGERYIDDQSCLFEFPNYIPGNYSCSMANGNSSGYIGESSNYSFIDAPKVRQVDQGHLIQDHNYSLECVTDLQNTSVSWMRMDPVNKYIGISELIDGHIISIHIRSSLDYVTYRCQVSLPHLYYGEGWSDSYTVYMRPPSAPSLSEEIAGANQLGAIQYTHSFQFKCDGRNAELYTLYKDGVRVVTAGQNNGDFLIFRSGNSGANYTCTASNRLGESDHSNPVFVQGKDDVVLTASTPQANVGQPLTLTCSVQNITEPVITYKWTIYSKQNNLSNEVKEGNLTFNPVTLDDEGLYICEAQFDGKTIKSNNYYTINTAPPEKPEIKDTKIGLSTEHHDATSSDMNYYLLCTCRGISCDPKNPFRLYKNGIETKTIPFRDESKFLLEFILQRYYTLDISVLENEGNYTCTSTNSFGESEHSSTISVPRKEEFPVPIISTDNPNPSLYSNITLTCHVPSNIFDAQVQWLKYNGLYLRTGRTLTLQYLNTEDDGRYACKYNTRTSIASNIFIERQSDNYYLIAREPLQPLLVMDIQEEENIYRFENETGTVFFMFGIGDIIRLRCFSQQAYQNYFSNNSVTVTTFTLYKNGQKVATANSTGKFEVSGLALGTYHFTCLASNNIGDSSYSYPLTVNVVDKPSIIASSVSLTIGSNLTLTCSTKQASDGSDIIWKKNGKNLPQTSPELSFIRLSPHDEGMYTCRQKIKVWYHPNSDEYYLAFGLMAATPDIFTLNPTILDIGSPLKLYCLTTSSTSYQAVFYRNGQAVRTVKTAEYDSAGQMMYTYSVLYTTSDDSGNYTCAVTNSRGSYILSVNIMSERSDILIVNIKDVNECTSKPCHVNEVCLKTLGSFTCQCAQGYTKKQNGGCASNFTLTN